MTRDFFVNCIGFLLTPKLKIDFEVLRFPGFQPHLLNMLVMLIFFKHASFLPG